PVISAIGSLAQARSAAIACIASRSFESNARVCANTGSGPIDAAVDQQAVVVAGDSSANLLMAPSCGKKWTRPFQAASQSSSAPGREYFAATSVGAASTTRLQKSGGNKNRNARPFP